ncbi:MAG TPA: ATP-binding protein [Phycisphaerae bacterium]|nr:ATP-binding protein [Phycisphaerae bacterium]
MNSLATTRRNPTRAAELFAAHQREIYIRTDRMFALLMAVQFVAGILAAVFISPKTWYGSMSRVHIHVWAALIAGGLIAMLPIVLVLTMQGRLLTRCVIASAQMLTSGLLIHLSGGRIETHFHVFGSLAFLAFYRDWRVFIPATTVVALDHLVRGYYWPESVYGVLSTTPWRSLEHAAWVIFEDIFLIYSCVQTLREMRQIADNQAALEETNTLIAEEVRRQTAELTQRSQALRQEVADRIAAEREREQLHRQLLDITHEAGMAEVATSVLHNVGNVLNSVNVSATLVVDQVKRSEVADLVQVSSLLKQHGGSGDFFVHDERGKLIPGFLMKLADRLQLEQQNVLSELQSLGEHVGHIKQIVDAQQSFARAACVEEELNIAEIVETALKVSHAALSRHRVEVIRDFDDVPPARCERHKLLQILVNLITNAKHALTEKAPDDRRLTLRIKAIQNQSLVRVEVIDNGRGIRPEHLERVFTYGFTTRKDGHGFGLHSAAVTARSLGASLVVHSDGHGQGARFVLDVPLEPALSGVSG